MSDAPDASGLYFLYQGPDLVYIGKADTSIRSRLVDHLIDKEFDRIKIRLIPEGRCRMEEQKELAAYVKRRGQLPFYNRQV